MTRKLVLTLSLTTSLVMLTIILLSRKYGFHDTEMVGGPCTYKETYHPIIIKNIIPKGNSGSYDLELINFAFLGEDSIVNYHFLNNSYLEKKEIETLHKGDTITLVEQNITSGTCTPHILSVELKKYDAKYSFPHDENTLE